MVTITFLLVLLAAAVAPPWPAAAEETPGPDPPPGRAADARPARHRWLIPACEVAAVDLTIWAVDAWVSDYGWAQISAESILHNLTAGFVYDNDAFHTNLFSHPYHGSLLYNAPRSWGFSPWISFLYTLGGSWAWEVLLETNKPSANDMITTVIGGSLFGEVLFRLSRLMVDGTPRPGPGRRFASIAVSPMAGLNALLFDGRIDGGPPRFPPWEGRLLAGGAGGAYAGTDGTGRLPLQAHVGFSFAAGLPGEATLRRPFDLFDFSLDFITGPEAPWDRLTGPPGPAWVLALRGLLLGAEAGGAGRTRIAGGLFGAFEYSGPTTLRAGVTALGPGITAVWMPAGPLRLEATLLAAPAFGTGGAPVPLVYERDYAFAYGLLGIADLRARLRDRLELRVALHAGLYPFPVGAMRGQGAEAILLGTGSALVRLGGPHALAFDSIWAVHRARFSGHPWRQRTAYYGLAYVLRLGGRGR